jgi:hypothetical protein
MVQAGCFKVSLVSADDKKTKFQEHSKDGKTFVEVEPDAEYFISIAKPKPYLKGDAQTLLAWISVDDKPLGYSLSFRSNYQSDEPSIRGIYSLVNGESTHKALVFTKPKVSQDGTANRGLLMGKVEVKIYEGVFAGLSQRTNFSSSFSASSVDLNQSGLSKKKSLRSGEGTTSFSEKQPVASQHSYHKGKLIDTITLNYCAALGLIEVGVLPQPDLWTHHRMKRPAPTGQKMAVQPKKVRPQSREIELFDLADTGSDEE